MLELDISVAWGEMDALGHLNNAVYFRYFESARILFLNDVGLELSDQGHGPILASTRCDFLRPVIYPDTITAKTWVNRVGRSSFTMVYELLSKNQGVTVAKGEGVVVHYDFQNQKSAPLTDELRAAIERHLVVSQ